MARKFKWDRTAQRLQDRADSKAKEIGPVADELNRRGFRSVQGLLFTRGMLNDVLQRWREMQRREAR